jgi:5-aminolevulinate synthase
METLLRKSRGVCPFLKKTSPATLRSLSTSTALVSTHAASPGGGRMSNLQVLARRCPVMGKAMAVQTARHSGILQGVRAYHTKGKTADRALFHSASQKEAQAVDVGVRHKNSGTW